MLRKAVIHNISVLSLHLEINSGAIIQEELQTLIPLHIQTQKHALTCCLTNSPNTHTHKATLKCRGTRESGATVCWVHLLWISFANTFNTSPTSFKQPQADTWWISLLRRESMQDKYCSSYFGPCQYLHPKHLSIQLLNHVSNWSGQRKAEILGLACSVCHRFPWWLSCWALDELPWC